jgi:hypothetical protein
MIKIVLIGWFGLSLLLAAFIRGSATGCGAQGEGLDD